MDRRNDLPKLLENGKRPACAWPGGYPLVYFDRHGEPLCAECASPPWPLRGQQGPWLNRPFDCDIHWEGDPIECDDCGWLIESAYGPMDEDEDEDHSANEHSTS